MFTRYTAHSRSDPSRKVWKGEFFSYICATEEEIKKLGEQNCLFRGRTSSDGPRSNFTSEEISEISQLFTNVVVVAEFQKANFFVFFGVIAAVIASIFLG